MMKMLLPDINVWLALTFSSHVHHGVAKAWFDGLVSDGNCFFCRLTQQGFLRLATNAKVFGTDAVGLTKAWQLFDAFANDPRVSFAAEPAALEMQWRAFTQSNKFATNVWSDAYLAAFALTAGMQIVTFDQGFSQFANLNLQKLA
jgi:toxin-antitoxin system PIN domain toxin